MRRLLFRLLLVVALPGLLGACASASKKHPAPAAPEAPLFTGRVTLVDEAGNFVLIDGSYAVVPADGVLLRASSQGNETAQLKVSPEKRRPFVIADIVSGKPQVGDQVVEVRSAKKPDAPAESGH